jgi:hypothetical protein
VGATELVTSFLFPFVEYFAMRFLLVLLSTVLLLPAASFAQEFAKPTKEHEMLKELEGEWEFVLEGGVTGTATYKMQHGGLWLESKLEMPMPTGKFTGQGLDSYDPNKKKFVSIWVDNMSSTPIISEGVYDAAKKTLTMAGKGPNESGQLVDYKMVTHYKDKDTHTFKMWMGSATGAPMMDATYKRKK